METAIVVFLLLFVCGCALNQTEIVGRVLPHADAGDIPYSLDGKTEGFWVPTGEILSRAEPAILRYIEEQDGKIFANIDRYRCQYVGIVVQGKKRVYCNFFWPTEDEADWKENFVFVLDGGDMYFQLEYDVDSSKCLNFSVNGEA